MTTRPFVLLLALLGSACSTYQPPTVRAIPLVPEGISESFRLSEGSVGSGPPSSSGHGASPVTVRLAGTVGTVRLDQVLASVDRHFPGLIAVRSEIDVAEARILAAQGAFDTSVTLDSKNKIAGFYEHAILDVAIVQPLETFGANVRSGYRYGLGDFGSYDGDITTNAGGEFFVGFEVPLLKNNAIDTRRAQLWKMRLERDATAAGVHQKRVELTGKATASYWKCVATARKVEIATDLLELARSRRESLAQLVAAGQLSEIMLPDNDRLVLERQAALVGATRKFELSAIGLSLYLRDEEGRPSRVGQESLPAFPELPPISASDLEAHVAFGLSYRPELIQLSYDLATADVERQKHDNDLLPKFDFSVSASQDVGSSTSSSRSDDPFEFGVGLKFEVPLARRTARGRLAATQVKISQLRQKMRLAADQVEAEIRDAASALARSREQLVLNRDSVRLARILEQAERDLLLEGESDLLRVNLREQSTAKARSDEIEARLNCFLAVADYRAALGLPEAETEPR